MKKIMLLTTCLALISLACLSTAAGLSTMPTATAVPTKFLVSAAVQILGQETPASVTPTAREKNNSCAQITADNALHLRSAADPTSRSLAFMRRGEVVRLISTSNSDWWLIERGELVGYARARYMTESECE